MHLSDMILLRQFSTAIHSSPVAHAMHCLTSEYLLRAGHCQGHARLQWCRLGKPGERGSAACGQGRCSCSHHADA